MKNENVWLNVMIWNDNEMIIIINGNECGNV